MSLGTTCFTASPKIDALREDLPKPEIRTEAVEILRGLIEGIKVKHTGSGPIAEIVGDIVQLITLSEDRGVPPSFESSVKVVAGARYPPYPNLGSSVNSRKL